MDDGVARCFRYSFGGLYVCSDGMLSPMPAFPPPFTRPLRGRTHLRDSANFWVALGAAVVLASSIPLGIGVARTPHDQTLWSCGWFIAGVGIFAIGALMLLWSLVLFLAHRHAEGHMCPNPEAHKSPEAETRGVPVRPVQLIVTDEADAKAMFKQMGGREFEHLEPSDEGSADDEVDHAGEEGPN